LNFKGLYLLLVFFIFVNCSQNSIISDIDSNNLLVKIDEVFLESELKDDTSGVIPLLFYIDENNFVFKDPCVMSKVLYLRALKNYTLSEKGELLKNVQKALTISENCDNNEIKTLLNNILGIYYYNNNKDLVAIDYYKKAIFYGKKTSNTGFVIDTYYSLCVIQAKRKVWDEVIRNAKNGIAAIKNSNTKRSRLKYFYIFLAEANTSLGEYGLVERYLNEAVTITNDSNYVQGKNDVLKSYREIYLINAELNRKQGKFDLAYKFMKASDSLSLLQVKSQHVNMNQFLDTELELENKLEFSIKKVIYNYRIIIIGGSFFILVCAFFIYNRHEISKKLKLILVEKEELNIKLLDNLNQLEAVHASLIAKNEEIKSLLKYNEQSLFTKTLKISNYKDAVNNVVKNIDKLIESKESIASVKMHSVNRSLQQVISEEEIWGDFKIEFEKTRPDFFEKLNVKCNSLSIVEQKHCAYVAVNLKSKEVASILNLSPRSVETTRYRIKKKLELEESLQEFLNKL
jgi:hypothetical protein